MTITFRELSQKFIAWNKTHRAFRSGEYYENYISHYLAHLADKADMPPEEMRPYHIGEWCDAHPTWSDNYRRGAVIAINRVYNWGCDEGYINVNPIKKAHKPPATRRKEYYKPDDFDEILHMIHHSDPFREIVMFMWITGCRPQEARCIEHRHINIEKKRIIFPKEEAKGRRHIRRILLNDDATKIILCAMAKSPEGIVFRNSKGKPWTKNAICERFYRIQKKTGKKLTSYCLRHGFGTRKLKEGHGHIQIATCMGHVDGSMLAKIYSHVDEDEDHLREVLD